MLLDASGYETGTGAGVTARFRFTLIESGRPLSKVFYRREDGVVDKIASAQLAEGYAREFAVGSLEELNALLNRLTGKQAAIWGVTGRTGQVKVVAEKYRVDGEITRTLKYFAWPAGPGFLMIDLDRPEQPEPGFYYPEREAAVAALRSLHPVFTEVPILWRPSASSGVEGEGIKGQRLYVPVRDARLISEASGVLADLQWLKGWGRIELAKDGSPLTRGLIDTAPWQPNWLDFVGPPVLRDGIRRDPPPAFIDPGLLDSADLSPLLKLDTKALRREADALRDRAKQAKAREAMAVRTAYKWRTGRDYLPDDPLNAVQTLGPDHVLEDRHGDRITVGELLADPERWHGVQLRDPLEPDYRGGSLVAKAFLVNCQPLIVSYAHGKKRYRLHDPERDFAGLETVEEEEGGREEDGQLLDPERPLLRQPMPLWASDRLAVQIRANAKEGYSEPTHATLLEALAQRNVLTVDGPTGSGKTTAMVNKAVDVLTLGSARKLLILSVPTRKARQHLVKKLNAALAKEPWNSERLAEAKKRTAVLLSGQKVPPLLNPKTGESAYRVVICTHAMITQRGDDPADEGRLITMIDHARETEARLGLSRLEITKLLDEGDAFVTSQEKSIPLESRVREGADPKTEEVGPGRTRICVKNCGVCHHHPAETNAKTVFNEDGLPLFRFIPEPTSRRSLKVSTQEIIDAMANDSVCLHGTAVHPLIRADLPTDRDVSRFVMGDPDAGTRDRYLPCPEGILIDMARAAFATVRYTFPRDKTTRERLRPEETEGREVLWPKRPCNVRTLVTWDARPLERLRDLIGADGQLTLLSATWTDDALTLLHNLFEGRSHAVVAHPEEHKMAGVLVITVPTLPMAKERIAPFVKVAPVFATLPRTEHVRQHSKQIMDWGGSDIVPAIWQDGYRDRDDADFPNFLLAHSRAPISRGADLGRYKIVMVHNGVHSALMDTLGASVNLDELLDAVEANRRSLVVQVVGRIMRRAKLKDSEEPDLSDPTLRVIIYIGEEDPITHEWIDNGAWLVDRLKNQIKDRNVQHLILQLNPNRAPEAARQFLAGEAVTVTDQMEGNSARMTARVRALTADTRKEGREARSLARREATRERKRKELEALARETAEPKTWAKVRDQLNLRLFFDQEEVKSLKDQFDVIRNPVSRDG